MDPCIALPADWGGVTTPSCLNETSLKHVAPVTNFYSKSIKHAFSINTLFLKYPYTHLIMIES